MPRFFCPTPLVTGDALELPAGVARHVQVLRLQPGDAITLFNNGPGWDGPSPGGEFDATVTRMGRSDVQVQVGAHLPVEREPRHRVQLAVGMPANDRMDWLIEKATEMGVYTIQPLMSERSVLRLSGERADKKIAHWQSVAIAASEQCGGNRVPTVMPVANLAPWLAAAATHLPAPAQRLLLSLNANAKPVRTYLQQAHAASCFLSGPEGGLSAAEEAAALAAGFAPVTLGPRILRAETAALFALAGLLAP
ncbi:MAG: 16S rRNA (uracil(1498)-N(3))-methyltransferase [Rhodoferax sp.]|nr:16S rRNA (uracil(1498)-N(3))-methyltransferase [Rhodoferax sp.]